MVKANFEGFKRPSAMRRRRFDLGMTLDEVFIMTGIPCSTLSKIERGVGPVSPEKAAAIAAALQSMVREIFPKSDTEK